MNNKCNINTESTIHKTITHKLDRLTVIKKMLENKINILETILFIENGNKKNYCENKNEDFDVII